LAVGEARHLFAVAEWKPRYIFIASLLAFKIHRWSSTFLRLNILIDTGFLRCCTSLYSYIRKERNHAVKKRHSTTRYSAQLQPCVSQSTTVHSTSNTRLSSLTLDLSMQSSSFLSYQPEVEPIKTFRSEISSSSSETFVVIFQLQVHTVCLEVMSSLYIRSYKTAAISLSILASDVILHLSILGIHLRVVELSRCGSRDPKTGIHWHTLGSFCTLMFPPWPCATGLYFRVQPVRFRT
jgi:hypothetical protein